MQNIWIDNRIRNSFRSIGKVLLHFTISLVEFLGALGILALEIILILTQTCAYHIGVGFWSMPFLFLSSISLWIVIWRRTSIACFIAIIIHLIATLFATSIIIISFLSLIGQISCSKSSLNMSYIPLHSSFIAIASLLKIFNYWEIFLLCKLKRNTSEIPTIFSKDLYESDSSSLFHSTLTNTWHSWSTIGSEVPSDLDSLFV